MLSVSDKGYAMSENERCDIRVWSGACDRGPDHNASEKYLCSFCETISGMDHEVRHETFPHVSGDYTRMM